MASAPSTASPLGADDDQKPPAIASPRAGLATVALGALGLAALVAMALGGLSATEALAQLGLPDPGIVTRYGLPAMQAIAIVSGVAAVGAALHAAFLAAPQANGLVDVAGYRSLRIASGAAALQAASAFVLVPLVLSDTTGQPFRVALQPGNLWPSIPLVESALAWAWTGILAAAVALGARIVLRWGWTPLVLAGALLALMPLVVTGHSSSGGSHDIATNSFFWHVVGSAVWLGGLFALLVHAWFKGAHLDVAVRRYSWIAGIAFLAVGVSGVINALVRVAPGDVFTTTYGWLLVAKAIMLGILGAFGYMQRRRVVDRLATDPRARGPFVSLAAIEVLLLAATVGLGVGLARTPPPAPSSIPSFQEVALGYQLEQGPSLWVFLTQWRFDLIFGTAAIVLATLYILGVRRLSGRGDAWPIGRTIAWLSGCAALLLATSSGMGKYSHAMFSVHMSSHMILSMLVPTLLALGGPVTLALRALPPAGRGGVPGPREWIVAGVHSPVSRALTQPIVAAVLFVSSFYILYFGGIFSAAADSHTAHVLMNVHFLLTGYLFYWVIIGVDPSPHPLQPFGKLALLWATLPFHAFFGIALMNMDTVMGRDFYQQLALPWVPDLLDDQAIGGSIAWGTGEIPIVIVMLALLVQWSASDRRVARRVDRAADKDDDADLAAYNAMLAELARRER
ncbi:bifunctional copper resistance protein CopD/cytochrome c oxidase assembly protein [Hoyosella sp. G463]|uniref:Bifunctional copper resistance protein CopD/cytochrome c oxidase assembly protein n=1 Tax=Lolliginicoccus lacisalsi TaxID=2742202 RepID=A0A927JB93_9ACTN|nr:cytochrome c oxidase assembly protein [Lolliginicoccus lacisalsi]MBD8505710.1 bifunctional copper resistance protein CopD/cytochrome c oxidase assembly protein [Lolliginicoccus lacisalsi]